jgi:hypothetical protein
MGIDKQTALLSVLTDNRDSFLEFFKAKYPVFNNSNIFFRDFQFCIQKFLEKKDIKASYKEAEELAGQFSVYLEGQSVFTKVNNIGWRLNYPDFSASVPFPKAN